MDQRYTRHNEAMNRYDTHDYLTQYGSDLFRQQLEGAYLLRVQVADINNTVVIDHANKPFTVCLSQSTCSCGYFQQNILPCSYAVAFIRRLNHSPRLYTTHNLTVANLQATYLSNLNVVNVEALFRNPLTIQPAQKQTFNSAGRRVTARRRYGQPRSTRREDPTPRCGRCRQPGHNITQCTAPPVM